MKRHFLAGLATLGVFLVLGGAPAPTRERSEPPARGLTPAHEEPSTGGVGRDLTVDPGALEALLGLQAPAACVDGRAAGVFPCLAIALTGFLPLGNLQSGARSGSNLWGFVDLDDGREYAVMGLNTGTTVVEVTDPVSPRVVGAIAGPTSSWRELKIYQRWNAVRGRHDAWAYVVSEAPTAGLQIIDLSNLPASVSHVATFRGFDTAHTIFLANVDPRSGVRNVDDVSPVLYIAGSDQGLLSLDLSDPIAPTISGRLVNSYVHDVWAGVFRGPRASRCAAGHDPCELLVDWGGDAVRLVDFTERARSRRELADPGPRHLRFRFSRRSGNLDELHAGDRAQWLRRRGSALRLALREGVDHSRRVVAHRAERGRLFRHVSDERRREVSRRLGCLPFPPERDHPRQ